MLGTLLAERLLDIAVILTLFVVVGYGLLGEAGAGEVEWILLATGGARRSRPSSASILVRRNERLHAIVAPVLSSTLQLRGRHGATLLGVTMLVWALEAGVWMSTGAAAGFPMDPIEGCYIVALASVFALIPSGPGYAGTQDAAAVDRHPRARRHPLAGRDLPDPRALRHRRADHRRSGSPCSRRATAGLRMLRPAR